MKRILLTFSLLLMLLQCSQKKELDDNSDSSLTENQVEVLPQDSFSIIDSTGNIIRKISYTYEADSDGVPLYLNSIKGFPESKIIKGHFNKKLKETEADVFYEEPKPDQSLSELKTKIVFSDKTLQEIDLGTASNVFFKNEGDINNDGLDEIGYMIGSSSSSCRKYFVVSYSKNKWKNLFTISSTLNMRQAGIAPVEKTSYKTIKLRMSLEGFQKMFPKSSLFKWYKKGYSCQESDVLEIILNEKDLSFH